VFVDRLFLVYDKRCSLSHWQPLSEISIFLITTFLELRVIEADNGQVSHRPSLACCSVPLSLEERHGRSAAWQVWIRHGRTV